MKRRNGIRRGWSGKGRMGLEWGLEEENGCGKKRKQWEEEERVGKGWDQSSLDFDLQLFCLWIALQV